MADPTDAEHQESEQDRNWRKLEDRAKKAEDRAERAERKAAFLEAGLSGLSDKQVKALVATHDGEMTAEALKATATELGFTPKTEAQPEAEVDPEQVQRDQEVAELSRFAGAAQPQGSSVMSQAEIDEKIASFTSTEALQEWVLANAELFGN